MLKYNLITVIWKLQNLWHLPKSVFLEFHKRDKNLKLCKVRTCEPQNASLLPCNRLTNAESYNLCSNKKYEEKNHSFFFREEVCHIMELSPPLIKFSAMPRPSNFIMLSKDSVCIYMHNIRIHFTLYEKVMHVCLDNVHCI